MTVNLAENLESVKRMTRDLRKAAATLSRQEVRYLVDSYYQMQEDRKRGDNQVRSLAASGEPSDVIDWFSNQSRTIENGIKSALDAYSKSDVHGQWARSVCGVGPVIASGLLAHIDMKRARTVGQIWRFAGLDPTVVWGKGEKRPWNASLKTLCWKIGEQFVWHKARETCVYGKVFEERKALEISRNDEGGFADQAAAGAKRVGKSTEAYKHYKEGKLPPAHIHARAKRYAVKLFLSHYHHMGYKLVLGEEPPVPYPIAILGHAHMIEP